MPREKINEEKKDFKKNNEKNSSVEKKNKLDESKGKMREKKGFKETLKKALPKTAEKKSLPKAEEKKALPKTEGKKSLPKVDGKKALPKTKETKKLPKKAENKFLPKTKKKTVLEEQLTAEEKDRRLLERIKEFFSRNPNQTSVIGEEVDEQFDFLPEYYDLPYRYNETVVKILAQTPKRLFIYWDICDNDIQRYRKAFGEDFFEKTYPVLLVHNEEMNYTYEVPINDFANSWYLDIKDAKCKYTVQLGRKFKEVPHFDNEKQELVRQENINLKNDYIEIVSSNTLEAPNDHVLFEEIKNPIVYRNVKNGQESYKDVKDVIPGFAKVYNVLDLYKVIYQEEMKYSNMFDLNNPGSSGNPSSGMTSGMF